VMMPLRIIVLLTLSLFCLPSLALAAQCGEIFPQGITDNINPNLGADGLDLTGRTLGAEAWPANGGQLDSGEYVFEGSTLTNYSLELAPGAEVTIFVDGNVWRRRQGQSGRRAQSTAHNR